jgi:dTDP-glucose 4,6-dehydratase
MSRVLVTGGAGFIGSALCRRLVLESSLELHVVDSLTYAGDLAALASCEPTGRYHFFKGDIADASFMAEVFQRVRPTWVFHLAAETHVDRSIDGPGAFIQTNIVGTFTLLREALKTFESLASEERDAFRFLHISTDEVFGALGKEGRFDRNTPYAPRSPYSASKAASDHLARAWAHTYGLPVMVTNCSNNYGPFQYPEKLIPLMIAKALAQQPMPIYGDGQNVRDWLHVDDHAEGLLRAMRHGDVGGTYLFGGDAERTNLTIAQTICDLVDEALGRAPGASRNLISFVADRPGHDWRYAIDASTTKKELSWKPSRSFEAGIRQTVHWFLENREWLARRLSEGNSGARLGLSKGT